MTMQRRHFELIAEALRDSKPEPHWDANKQAQWEVTINRFLAKLRSTNPNFNEARFLRACGVAD